MTGFQVTLFSCQPAIFSSVHICDTIWNTFVALCANIYAALCKMKVKLCVFVSGGSQNCQAYQRCGGNHGGERDHQKSA